MGARGSYPEVKWLGHEATHSPATSDEVRISAAIHPLPLHAFMAYIRTT